MTPRSWVWSLALSPPHPQSMNLWVFFPGRIRLQHRQTDRQVWEGCFLTLCHNPHLFEKTTLRGTRDSTPNDHRNLWNTWPYDRMPFLSYHRSVHHCISSEFVNKRLIWLRREEEGSVITLGTHVRGGLTWNMWFFRRPSIPQMNDWQVLLLATLIHKLEWGYAYSLVPTFSKKKERNIAHTHSSLDTNISFFELAFVVFSGS